MPDMRDDLHRGLPLPSAWRRVVRDCSRGGRRVAELAAAALLRDCDAIRPSFQQQLQHESEAGFPFYAADRVSSLEVRGPFEAIVQQRVRDQLLVGRQDAYEAGITSSVLEVSERRRSSVWQQVRLKAPADGPLVDRLIAEGLRSATPHVAACLLGKAESRPAPTRTIDFDQDLR